MPSTRVIRVDGPALGRFDPEAEKLAHWRLSSESDANAESMAALRQAARLLKESDVPVALPTETVYGLAADATRSSAVRGIYSAKGRPLDNPLIVHVCDLEMLRNLLRPREDATSPKTNGNGNRHNGHKEGQTSNEISSDSSSDPIPAIYKPLIEKFWPGPLTILLPNPTPSHLAPEVTAGLPTFGARMPASPLTLSLIQLASAPLAAPSANASTKPSPTTAQHVVDDLDGRIELVLDGGACTVGVESTVVDGLCEPPAVLRPGGISLEELRACEGWEGAVKAYKDASEEGNGKAAPRAPGMKYKHYSPRARVVLYEAGCGDGREGIPRGDWERVLERVSSSELGAKSVNGEIKSLGPSNGDVRGKKIGVIRTRRWKGLGGVDLNDEKSLWCTATKQYGVSSPETGEDEKDDKTYEVREGQLQDPKGDSLATVLDIHLGEETKSIAKGLFSALRELDRRGVDLIFVDGIHDADDMAAAVMNRLRKAASEIRS